MSVTFTVSMETIREFDGQPHVVYMPQYPQGFDPTPVVDPEFPEYGAIPPTSPWEMNVSNSNFSTIMQSLGLEFSDWCGVIADVTDLIARCEALLGTVRSIPEFDAGVKPTETRGEMGALIVNCGVRPGYLVDRIGTLLSLAIAARDAGAVVTFA